MPDPRRFERWIPAVEDAASSHGVDPALLLAILHAESLGNPSAVSQAGALGLMQLMPQTASSLGVRDPLDPIESIRGGARYLSELGKRFSSPEEIAAAYNAGPSRVRRGSLPSETQQYIDRVSFRVPVMRDLLASRQAEALGR